MIHLLNYKLFEGKQVGTIYHFTDIFSLNDLTKDYSEHEPSLNFKEDDSGSFNLRNMTYFISTTRKFDFIWNPIRFSLNGNKISEKYKIVPIDYFSLNPKDLEHFKRDPNQYEERIITKKENESLSIKDYCIRVDICTDPKYDYYGEDPDDEGDDIKHHMHDVHTAYSYFEELGIPCSIVNKFKPVK